MKRLLTLLCAAIGTFYLANAATPQWYLDQWSEVSKLENDQKPVSAQKVVDEIFKNATEDKNYLEILNALTKQLILKKTVNWNETTTFVDSLRKLEHLFQGPLPKSAYYLRLIQWMDHSRVSYNSTDKSDNFYTLPISKWSSEQKCKAIEKYIMTAIAYADSVKDEKPGRYAFLNRYNEEITPSKNNYIWIRRAIINTIANYYELNKDIKNRINDELLAVAKDDHYLLVQTLMNDQRKNLNKKCDSLIALFPDHPAIVYPTVEKLKLMERNDKLESFTDIDRQLDELILRFPDSRYIKMAINFKQKLYTKTGEITTPEQIYPGKKTYISIKYRNIDSLDLAIYRLPDSTRQIQRYEELKRATELVKTAKPVIRKNIKLEPELNINKKTTTDIEVKEPGKYMLVSRIDKDSILSVNYFNVSRVAAIGRNTPRGVEIYTADFQTGKPFKKVDLNVDWRNKKQNDNLPKRIKGIKGDVFSIAMSPDMLPNEYSIMHITASVGKDKFSVPIETDTHLRSYENGESKERTVILTDRARYTSRDTIFFKAYTYEFVDGKNQVCEGFKNEFTLSGPDNKQTFSKILTSDAFGGYDGYFVLDGTQLSGRYSIEDPDGNSALVQVGDFKLPMLHGKIEPLKNDYSFGDTVECLGSILSYAGFPVEGVLVKYSVECYPDHDLLSYNDSYFYYQESIVDDVETTTDSNGNFIIRFAAPRPEEVNGEKTAVSYSIKVSITDERGETQQFDAKVNIGDYKYSLTINVPEHIDRSMSFKPTIQAFSKRTTKVAGATGTYIIKERESERTVMEGSFVADEPISIDWSKLECKRYDILFKSELSSEFDESFLVYDSHDTMMPKGNDNLFIVPKAECVQDEPIEFMYGTTAEKQHAVVELFYGDSLLWTKNMVFDKGLRKYTVPYPAHFPDNVCLYITTIYNGKHHKFDSYYKRQKAPLSQIGLKLVTLRETAKPGTEQTIAVEVKDDSGKGVESSVLVSVFDKAMDYKVEHSFHKFPLMPFRKETRIWSSSSCFGTNDRYFMLTPEHEKIMVNGGDGVVSSFDTFGQDITTIGYATESIDVSQFDEMTVVSAENRNIAIPSVGGNNDESMPGDALLGIVERSDFRHTAAFITDMVTDADGYANAKFTLPDALTTYRVLALAVDKGARSAVTTAEMVVRKDLMVITNYPQYLRSGDLAELRIQARNLSKKDIEATLTLTSACPKDTTSKTFSLVVPANSSKTVSWEVKVSHGVDNIVLTADLDGKDNRDIEKRTIPVIEAREHFTSGKIVMVNDETVEIDLSEIVRNAGENEKLSVKVGSAQAAILKSLPLAIEPDPKSLIDIVNNWYINGAGNVISRKYNKVIDIWVNGEKKANVIDINTPMTKISASETPWKLRDNVAELGKALQDMKDNTASGKRSQKMVSLFHTYQNRDGGYPWFKGMPSSRYLTMMLLDRYNALFDCGFFSGNYQYVFYSGAVDYLDNEMMSIYDGREKYTRLPSDVIDYLYVRAPLMRYKFADQKRSEMWSYIVDRVKKEWRNYPIYEIAKVAMALRQIDKKYDIEDMLSSLAEYAVPGKSFGTYFPNAVMPFRGMIESELRAHAIMLRLFDTSERYAELADGIAQWLMSQRLNQQWKNSTTTADVIWAITNHYDALNRKNPVLPAGYNIKLDNQYTIVSTPLRGTEIDIKAVRDGKLPNISVRSVGSIPCFVEVNYSCDLPLVAAEARGNGFNINRMLFREKKGGGEELITEKTTLKPGDVVIARYHIENDENRSFVVMKALRSGALEPLEDISGYSFRGYYREVKDSYTNYYFYTMPEGDNVIEERFHVWYTGTFSDGLVKVESLMAPAYSANTPAGSFKVTR